MFKTHNYIKFYKGYLLEQIHKELIKHDAYSKKEVDQVLKRFAGIEKSCCEMDYYEINELIVWAMQFGDAIGINLDFKDNGN